MSRKPDAHRLFFALMPPAGLLDELAQLRELTTQGKPEADNRLHITMFLFDYAPDFDANKVEQISAALDGQTLPTCRVLFEHLMRGKGAMLLLPNERLEEVFRLQARLAELLAMHGLQSASGWKFNPHMTLRRGKSEGKKLVIDPVSWTAQDIVLLDSHIGLTHYEEIARWRLEGKSQ
jgi:RNA 2',3'-cyclic 3'-phosphodiesterase